MEAEQQATQTYWCDEEEWRADGRGRRCVKPWGLLAGGRRLLPQWGQIGDGADEGLERGPGASLACCFDCCCEERENKTL